MVREADPKISTVAREAYEVEVAANEQASHHVGHEADPLLVHKRDDTHRASGRCTGFGEGAEYGHAGQHPQRSVEPPTRPDRVGVRTDQDHRCLRIDTVAHGEQVAHSVCTAGQAELVQQMLHQIPAFPVLRCKGQASDTAIRLPPDPGEGIQVSQQASAVDAGFGHGRAGVVAGMIRWNGHQVGVRNPDTGAPYQRSVTSHASRCDA